MTLTLVKTTPWTRSDEGDPAPLSASPGNTAGNLLVVKAAWCLQPNTENTAGMGAGSVADSAGNLWRLLTDSGAGYTGSRCAIWVCPNALAIPASGWLSFAVQGRTTTSGFLVEEFTVSGGGSYYPACDFGPWQAVHGFATAATMQAITGQADYCFTIGAQGYNGSTAPTITGPGAGWTAGAGGTTTTASNQQNQTQVRTAYGAFTAGTVTAAWAFGTVTNYGISACLGGLTQASAPPTVTNANYPLVYVEASFGAEPGDPTAPIFETGWVDLTSYTLTQGETAGIHIERGRQYELAQPESGTLTVQMNNVAGDFDPGWPGSPFYCDAINSNPCFQQGITGWTAVNNARLASSAAHTFASGQGAVSTGSLQFTGDGATAAPGARCEAEAVTPNAPYSMSAWVYNAAGWSSGVTVALNWQTVAGSAISTSASSAVPVPAATWTQVTLTGVSPPATARLATGQVNAAGTPGTAATFWVAEAGPNQGTGPMGTGLLRLEIPIRVTAYWQGRRYPVGSGCVERWPQDWPDMPQWGMSTLTATDQVGAASSTNMPSAVQGEILCDAPYACFPFSEQYSAATSTINGVSKTSSECDGLIAVNTSRVNQKTAAYHDGGSEPVETGQSLGFLGDSGTGMGTSGYSSFDNSGERGPGAQYGPDSGLPQIGASTAASFEMWFTVQQIADVAGTEQTMQLFQVLGRPNIASTQPNTISPGFILSAGVLFPATSGSPVIYIQATQNLVFTAGATPLTLGGLAHVVVVITGGTAGFYVNGVFQGNIAGTAATGPIVGLVFGEASWPYSSAGFYTSNWNYAMAYGTVYPYLLAGNRVSQHYTSGGAGFSGDSIMTRFGRYLAWSFAGLQPAGPGGVTDNMGLGPAYSTDGTALADSLNGDALSSGAMWYANANGNLVMLPRPALYNLPTTVTFGDDTLAGEVPYEPAAGFDYDNTYLQNIVQATLNQGPNTLVAPVEKDQGSINTYLPRGPLQQSVSGSSPQDAFDRAYWSLSKYAQPSMRVRSLTVRAARYPAAFTPILQTDLADVAAVNRRPVAGPAYSLPVMVQKVTHDIGPGVWDTTYQMSPYDQEAAVLTTDTGNDVLGSNTLAW